MVGAATITILHVEDEPGFADMVGTFLEREDERFEIETASNPEEGLDILSDNEFDCIVSDYDMPGQNGIEFLKAVREENSDLPFVLFTGKGSEEVASDAISAGVTDYLQKEAGTDIYRVLANQISNSVEKWHAQRNYRELFEKSTVGVVIVDPDSGTIVDANRQFSEILGRDLDEVRGAHPADLSPDEPAYTRDRADELLRQTMETGSQTFEWRHQRASGNHVWVEVSLNRTTINGESQILGIVQDISDRKKREQRYNAIFNQTYQFTGLLEIDGTLIEANETALEFGGLDREDVLGKKMWEAYWFQHSEETRTRAREAVERAATGEFVRHELPVQGATDEVIIDFSVRPITDEQGNVTLLIPEGRDITERKKLERKRERIIERVTDAIVEVDADWRFTLVNDQAEELYDMSEEDLLERDFWEVFEAAKDTRFEEEYRAVMETRESTSFVEYFSQLDGWFDIEAYPKDDGGIAFYFVEVTEQRQRQAELERSHEEIKNYRDLLERALAKTDTYVWEWDLTTNEVNRYPTGKTLSQLKSMDIGGVFDGFIERVHPDERERVEQVIRDGIESGTGYQFECRFEDKDGSYRWIRDHAEVELEDGEPVHALGMVTDITEAKRLTDARDGSSDGEAES